MAEQKKRRPKRNSAVHVTIWNMNGGPVPEDVQNALDAAVAQILSTSNSRLLSAVTRV